MSQRQGGDDNDEVDGAQRLLAVSFRLERLTAEAKTSEEKFEEVCNCV
jgi:hypothetical protein